MIFFNSEFVNAIEMIVESELERIGVDMFALLLAAQHGIEENNDVAIKLVQFLENKVDFVKFGELMELQFKTLFQDRCDSNTGVEVLSLTRAADNFHNAVQQKNSFDQSNEQLLPHVRVLWDIENVGVPKNVGALSTVQCIYRYSRKQFICLLH